MGRAGEVQGLWPGEQVGHTRGWSECGLLVLVFCVYAAFLSNQETGFGISICLIPWDLLGDISLGLEKQGRAVEVRILQTRRPRTPEPSVTREPKMSRTHVGDGESGVEIFKKA